MNTLVWGIRGAVAAVLAYAGFSKAGEPEALRAAILRYELVPPVVAEGLAAILPWLELTVAAGLWIPRVRVGAAGWVAALGLSFSVAIASALWRGLSISCGCFGEAGESGDLRGALVRAAALATAGMFLLWRDGGARHA